LPTRVILMGCESSRPALREGCEPQEIGKPDLADVLRNL